MPAQNGSRLPAQDFRSCRSPTPAYQTPSPDCAPPRCRSPVKAVVITSKDSGRLAAICCRGPGSARSAFQRGGHLPGQCGGSAASAPMPWPGRSTAYELSFEGGERLRGQFLIQRLDYCGRFQRRAQLHDAARKLGRGRPRVSVHGANPHRGEASLLIGGAPHVLRPSFAALIAAEEELGPLLALVERASAGEMRLSEIAGLFWHCLADRRELTREQVGEAVIRQGLAPSAKPLRALLGQILQGTG